MALFSKFQSGPKLPPDQEQLTSILENLNNVLNTKRDYGSLLRDFGICDLSMHITREGIARAVINEVRESIERYEPRVVLDEIVCNNDNNPLRLSFTIRCTIRENARSLQMIFDTVFGKVNVEG